jgi:hypothetical protein
MRLRRQLVCFVAALGLVTPGLLAATSSSGAGAAPPDPITMVQQSSAGTFVGSTNTITLSAAPHAGSLLLLVFRNGTDANDIVSVTGGGVTWVKAQSWTTPAGRVSDIWYGLNSTGVGTTITYTLTGAAAQFYTAGVSEWAGVAAVNAIDGNPAQASGTSTTPTTPTITPAVPNELFVGLIASLGAFGAGPGGGFTQLGLAGVGGAGFLIATDPAAHTMSWTTTSAAFTAGLVSFEPVQAAAPPAPVAPTVVISPRFTG